MIMFLVSVEHTVVFVFASMTCKKKKKVKVKTLQSTSVISTNSFPMEMSLIHFSHSL